MKKELLSNLPQMPGVYLFKDIADQVIYIGKATSLKNRIRSYFKELQTDWKIGAMVEEIKTIDHIVTDSETQAAILEAQLIQEYQPKYNILLKDGQPFLYLLFSKEPLPKIKVVRNKKEKGQYFGPFISKQQARAAHRYLLNTFVLNICNKKIEHGCLDYHLGTCPGTCKPNFDPSDYLFHLEIARQAIKNDRKNFTQSIQEKIQQHSKKLEFEKARNLQHYLDTLDSIFFVLNQHFSSERYATEVFAATTPRPYNPQEAKRLSSSLQTFFNTPHPIQTIDCFDVSHFQSRYIVGSCVRFSDGLPDKNRFRRFKIKTLEQQDDYAALYEIVTRRYKNTGDLPDLVLIDGGKGQLNAARKALPDNVFCAALAKREERLFSTHHPEGIIIKPNEPIGKILIALRDYAHHFAISYHKLLRSKKHSS